MICCCCLCAINLRLVLITSGFATMVGQSVAMRTEVARTVPQMALPSIADAKALSDEDIAKEILTAQKARCA